MMCSSKKTVVLKVNPDKPARELIDSSAKVIRDGNLVAFPTETVYGLAANLLNKKAIDKLYRIKKRPRGKPLTVHIASLSTIKVMGCKINKVAKALIYKFWPGPLTIILKSRNGEKIGFRMPDNKAALALIKTSGVPVVAPSANISGKNPPRSAKAVLKELDGKIDILLDGGRTKVGIESTVVDLTAKPFKILREGAIKRSTISKIIYGQDKIDIVRLHRQ